MSGLVYWIWMASRRFVKPKTLRLLLEHFGDPMEVFFADEKSFGGIENISPAEIQSLLDKDTAPAERIISQCESMEIGILTYQDAAYPERLRNIYDAPYVLYVRGNLPNVDTEPVIAVVGTRKATPYGEKMARNIGFELAKGGSIVVTGLAEGIDSRAAEGALMAQGKVIGVLGTSIDEVYPSFNTRLFDDVAATGAVVSEYPPETPKNPRFFPARNRIISGLSLGVTVVEAPFKSGSLITARLALEQGREVYSVPGNADSTNFRGSNALIREGAKLVENGWDILCEYKDLFPDKIIGNPGMKLPEERKTLKTESKPQASEETEKKPGRGIFKLRVPSVGKQPPVKLEDQLVGLSENQLKIIGTIGKRGTHIDDIIDISALPASTVLSELTLLQIKGVVTQESGKRFRLNITTKG